MSRRRGGIFFTLRPHLHLARVFCILPFTSLHPPHLRSNPAARILNSVIFLLLLLVFCDHVRDLYLTLTYVRNVKDTRRVHRFVVVILVECVKAGTALTVLHFSVGSCKVFDTVLSHLHRCDATLAVKGHGWWMLACGLTATVVKTWMTFWAFYIYANEHVQMRVAGVVSQLFPWSWVMLEQLAAAVCWEMSTRMRAINIQLANLHASHHSHTGEQLRKLRCAYGHVTQAQGVLDGALRPFLLLDCAEQAVATLTTLVHAFTLGTALHPARAAAYLAQVVEQTARLMLITAACDSVTKQAQETEWRLLRLSPEDQSSPNHEFTRQLQVMLAYARSSRHEFSAGGLFTIDLELFFTILGTICNYLFVITQFEINN